MFKRIFLPQLLVPKKSRWTSLTLSLEAAIYCETLLNIYLSTYLHFPEILNLVSTALRISYLGSPFGFMWTFMFSEWCCWRFKSCEMLQSLDTVVVTKVLKDRKHSSWALWLRMKTVWPFETLVTVYQLTWCNTPEDSNFCDLTCLLSKSCTSIMQ